MYIVIGEKQTSEHSVYELSLFVGNYDVVISLMSKSASSKLNKVVFCVGFLATFIGILGELWGYFNFFRWIPIKYYRHGFDLYFLLTSSILRYIAECYIYVLSKGTISTSFHRA